jgi:hypothetical protein
LREAIVVTRSIDNIRLVRRRVLKGSSNKVSCSRQSFRTQNADV